jgi:hypothetical protein
MRCRSAAGVTMTALCLLAADASPVHPAAPGTKASAQPGPAPRRIRSAVEHGLAFLEADATKWRKERKCSTCHHGTMTVWALGEAKSRGYAVNVNTLADAAKWTKERLAAIDKPRDERPGWNMVNSLALSLAVMALAVPGQDVLSGDERKRIAGHLVRHQEADGSWAWSLAPVKNRPPPVFESDEVATLLACAALGPHARGDAKACDSREKGAAWLRKVKPAPSTQARALRLFSDVLAGKSAKEVQPRIAALLSGQNQDGGWPQEKGLPSDAYATGQALYFLSLAGVKADRAEVQRGAAFLVVTQRPDGSWPMTSRAHPGAKPMTNPVPITHFGSSWATLGLLRSAPTRELAPPGARVPRSPLEPK